MSDSSLDSVQLQRCLDRWREGDRQAADELLHAAGLRLELLARKMLRQFPNVRRWADTGDVLQNALIRLLRSLQSVQPETTRDFLNFAAVHIRRELLDLARHFDSQKHLLGRKPTDQVGAAGADLARHADTPETPDELELWRRFHEAVEQLPVEEREVVSLTFYHGRNKAEIGDLLGVNERTVRRRWTAACAHLIEMLGGQLPPVAG